MENFSTYAKHHKYIVGTLAVIIVLSTAVFSRLGKNNSVTTQTQATKVSSKKAAEWLQAGAQINANGTVESLQQAELRAQVSAPVKKIYVSIGQQVKAGQLLVSLQNNDIAAQLEQAQSLLKAQEARLEELKKGARLEQIDLATTQVNAAKQALEDTKTTQDQLVKNAYNNYLNSGLAAIPNSSNIGSVSPVISGNYTSDIQGQYNISLYAAGNGIYFHASGLEEANGQVQTTPIPLGTRGLYIQFPSTNPSTGDSWSIPIPNDRSPLNLNAKNLYQTAKEAREAAINGANNGLLAAQKQYDLILAGASSQQIKAQEAAAKQAQAAVDAAMAMLEKTNIKSPINGAISALPVKYGELISPGSLVASVVNSGGLQIKAYVSDYDLPFLKEASPVLINNSASGTLNKISPSVNPQTKNVEVQILVNNPETAGLVVGQNAALKINSQTQASSSLTFLLPLQAVNISPNEAYVLILKSDKTLEKKNVILGNVTGEKVEIKNGLGPEMQIVYPVYELKEGQTVETE